MSAAEQDAWGSPFDYLKFHSGAYGLARLKQLAALPASVPDADDIRRRAAASLAKWSLWEEPPEPKPANFRDSLAKARIYPAGRTMAPPLQEALLELQQKRDDQALARTCSSAECFGLFVDLNKDGIEEFVLLTVSSGWAFEQHGGQWKSIGSVYSEFPAGKTWNEVLDALVVGNYSAVTPQWQELSIGGRQFRVGADR